MALYLARHGETDWNREQRFQARSDVPLNARGREQARLIREELRSRGVSFELARSSPLSRAVETAEIILAGTDTPYAPEPDFIELALGDYEGRLEAEIRQEVGEAAYLEWRNQGFTVPAPNGEALHEAAERVREPLLALAEVATAGNVLIVAHQAINMAMKAALSGRDDPASALEFKQANDEVDVWDTVSRGLVERFKVGGA